MKFLFSIIIMLLIFLVGGKIVRLLPIWLIGVLSNYISYNRVYYKSTLLYMGFNYGLCTICSLIISRFNVIYDTLVDYSIVAILFGIIIFTIQFKGINWLNYLSRSFSKFSFLSYFIHTLLLTSFVDHRINGNSDRLKLGYFDVILLFCLIFIFCLLQWIFCLLTERHTIRLRNFIFYYLEWNLKKT